MTRPCNDTFLRALLKEPTEYTPVWLMRQAGRYLPEYCETRRRAGSFLQLCKSPAMACEVTLQPLTRYNLDAAILFSDILTVPDAMGLGLYFTDGEGPRFERPLREEWAIRDLTAPDPWDHLRYVMDAVAEIRRALNNTVPLIGFSGSPYTLACYMVEGGASSDYRRIKGMLYDRSDLLHRILSVTADAVSAYLNAQIESGAQAVMIFDSWGGSLSAAAYQEFSLPYLRRIVGSLIRKRAGEYVPSIVFTKGGGLWLESIADIGCDAIGLDWMIDIGDARRRVGQRVALQGNLDPGVLFASPDRIAAEARSVLDSYGPYNTGHVFNLGHGISQFTPPENVAALVDAVHTHSRLLRIKNE
ncbi:MULTISPECIES: uroporphyrinogen decarboxylase [Candidatus Accumulibacter]|uniref:Uroporphyrinogen decarboxylase n=1 Tax=Candidatus Accumulibacter cognatus TaxID=2954383 RepID=A0A080MA81_9PROT|nr:MULTISPECIES: uroporphyrinogen decarboxylase [Candidatus Accumulibacter]KFB77355.1 MAG: Uroporphyrinogen decarboxylase [Candidatus Accumulibacter cognatus]MBL8401806.1 uroporphyrinogen decarboxylase [Accumulibacter sp.]QLH49828.1 MAG: uroporphyrinogen decarboxylase [Candidatus Accumulibacter cognatus]